MQRLNPRLQPSFLALLAGLFWITMGMPDARAQSPCGDKVTVRSGDTLHRIARRCDTSIPALLAQNPQVNDPNVIRVGWQLDVPNGAQPDPTPSATPAPDRPDRTVDAEDYTIRSGDTLGDIADRFGVSVAALMAANPRIKNRNVISVGWQLDIPSDGPSTPPVVTDPPAMNRTLRVMPTRGGTGARVHLKATGFRPHQEVHLGFGLQDSEYDVIEHARADAEGRLSVHVPVPDFARADRPYVFVAAPEGGRTEVISNVFYVDQHSDAPERDHQDGQLQPVMRIEGVMTGEGVECPALRTDDGTLYTLTGSGLDAFNEGDRVYIEGTKAELSICMQGTTVKVSHIESR